MNTAVPERAKFHHMKDGTLEDWTIIGAEVQESLKLCTGESSIICYS